MLRNLGPALALGVALAAGAADAQAQLVGGYGGSPGWGGWSSTGQGDFARGLGYFAEGEGVYNLNTAQAESIEADAVMRWNQFLYEAQRELDRKSYLRQTRDKQRTKDGYEARQRKLLSDPDSTDIESGSALNALLDQVGSAKKGSKSEGTSPIPAALIKDVPFQSAAQAVVVSLGDLTSDDAWPAALAGDEYAADRKAYRKAMDEALEQTKDGETVSPQTAAAVREPVARMRARFAKNPPEDKLALSEARDYLQALAGMSRMIQRPAIDKILGELESVKDTNLGNLLAFMHAYNLRFGPATTPRHREVYTQLHPILLGYRDRVIGAPKDDTAQADAGTPSVAAPQVRRRAPNFFRDMNFDGPRRPATAPDGTPAAIAAPKPDATPEAPAPDAAPAPKADEKAEPKA
ncbi:hypothetical protein EP7_002737 [Isosphaeraceae bacterium EP7]